MKFICTRENLSHALDVVGGIVGKQANLPILSHIFISATDAKVEFIATNLEIALRANVRAKVDMQGSFTVPAKTLADFVHLLMDEQVEVELQDNELHIRSGNSYTKIKGFPADEFPVIPGVEETHGYALLVNPFRDALSKVISSVARNDIRPELAGVYFGFFTDRFSGLLLASTDSYRLAEKKTSVSQGADEIRSIVPARTVSEMIRVLTLLRAEDGESQVRLWVSQNQIALRYDSIEMTSRLIDGAYPDYAQIIPETFKTTVVLPKDVLINKIKAASLFTTSGVNAVSLTVNAGEKTFGISSVSTQTGEHASTIDADVTGVDGAILLNHRYVLDGLQQMDTDEVEFSMNSSDAPCLFKPKGDDHYLYIVMPVRQ